MEQQLIGKFKAKADQTILLIQAPPTLKKLFPYAVTKAKAKAKYDAVIAFVHSTAEVDAIAPQALSVLANDGLLWMCYPKKSGSIKTDLSRDHGWGALTKANFTTVSLISIDDTWSSIRFRSSTKVKSVRADLKKANTPASTSVKKSFTAVIEKHSTTMDDAFVSIPFDVSKTFGSKGLVKVKASFDGHPYRGVLANMGTGCHVLLVRKDVRAVIKKNHGDKVKVIVELDTEERTIEIPADLEDAFAKHKKAKSFFDTLSYTNRKEYVVWITSAKKDETRERRVSDSISKLMASKKNPSAK